MASYIADIALHKMQSYRGKPTWHMSSLSSLEFSRLSVFCDYLSVEQFRTMDKLGPNATLLTGMLGAIEGIPVIVSEQMKLADTDGKVTDAGNVSDTGRLALINRTQWAQGFRRELTVDVDRDTQKRQTVVTVSFRHALTERSGTRSTANHTALQYNITGVA